MRLSRIVDYVKRSIRQVDGDFFHIQSLKLFLNELASSNARQRRSVLHLALKTPCKKPMNEVDLDSTKVLPVKEQSSQADTAPSSCVQNLRYRSAETGILLHDRKES
jgi:hypothetical protein